MYNPRNLPANNIDFSDFDSIRLTVASNDNILSWSHGEVLKSETMNYRTQKPEKDGLFCERIFGPMKDINPHDTRFKGARSRSIALDKKGNIVTKAITRRERMGHISLAAPVVHIWFLRVAPSPLSCITGLTIRNLEKIIYFSAYLVLDVNKDQKAELITRIDKIYKAWSQFIANPPYDEATITQELFDYLLKHQGQVKTDIWSLLAEINSDFAKQAEVIEEVKQHQLIDITQNNNLITVLENLSSIFRESLEIPKTKQVSELYQKFVQGDKVDLKANLKSEFQKIRRQLKNFTNYLKFDHEKLDLGYNHNLKILKDVMIKGGIITEVDYRQLPPLYRRAMTVKMGGEAIEQFLTKTDLNKLIADLKKQVETSKGQKQAAYLKRLKIIEGMKKADIDLKDFCLTTLPVIPPNLRPITQLSSGRMATSDLNDLYRRVINRNNRLKKFQEINAPAIMCNQEKRLLQEAVDALIDNSQHRMAKVVMTGSRQRKLKSLADILKRKQGRLRQHMLGKRVDYSGRSVIVVGPNLNMLECGLPKIMALELFKPFVIGYLINHEHVNNIRSASRLIENGDDVVWDALDQVIQDKFVLLNRAPTLHRLGVQAFKPKLIEGKAIQLHPLVCKGFNADFDGDQMAVHLPLSREAQLEASQLMVAPNNLLHPADGTPILYFDQDIVMGLYWLTYIPAEGEIKYRFSSVGEAGHALDAGVITQQTPIEIIFRGQRRQTTLGRVHFNEVFPEDFPYQDKAMSKDVIKSVMSLAYEMYDNWTIVGIADELKNLAFQSATKSGVSIGLSDFFKIDGYQELQQTGIDQVVAINQQFDLGYITQEERYRLIVKNWFQIDKEIQKLVNQQFTGKQTSLNLIVDSKARGTVNLAQIKRMMVSIGVVNDASGKALELTIKSNYFDGLPTLEYFVAARGARKTIIDIALSTAESGYLTRRLVYVAQDVLTVADDPKYVDPGFSIRRDKSADMKVNFATRLVNRYAAEEIKIDGKTVVAMGELINRLAAEAIQASELDSVKIMSALSTPNVNGIPTKSYGVDLSNGQLILENQPVGVTAAQSIGEPSTQLKLDSKHSGGTAAESQHVVNVGLNRVEELFEARNPKGLAILAPFAGTVEFMEANFDYDVYLRAPVNTTVPVLINKQDTAVVKVGQTVTEEELLAYHPDGQAYLAPMAGEIKTVKADLIEIQPAKALERRFLVPQTQRLLVSNQQQVEAGDCLSEGSLNLDQLLALKGIEETQRYILTEISKVFAGQGTHIADQHLEIIVRQMFSRIQVVDAGDSDFVVGDVLSKKTMMLENEALTKASKKPIVWRQLVLGITKVTSYSDSFLVAASFQDTTRTLVGAAIRGKVDKLDGLIENVILGRKIPVDTRLQKEEQIILDEDFE